MPIREHTTFLASFDALHRQMRLAYSIDAADFDTCVRFARDRRKMRAGDLAFLDQCRHIRNFLAHSNDVISTGLVGVTIDAGAIQRLDALRGQIAEKLPAARFAVPMAKVLTTGFEDRVEPLMRRMTELEYSHVPVMENRQVRGVFDERVLFRALADDRLDVVTSASTIRDVVDPFTFDKVDPADFGIIFAPRGISLADLRQEMERRKTALDRISLILLTENGSAREMPLSLMTIWDIPFDS